MSETTSSQESPGSGSGADDQTRMGPVARYLNVFFSPGKVFEDVRRGPSGWIVPILVATILTGLAASIYVSRYDIELVTKTQIKQGIGGKIVALTQGPEARDKMAETQAKAAAAIPKWALELSQWVNSFLGYTVIAWLFTFIYGLIAVLMGWLPPEARASKLWINLGIAVAIGAGFLAVVAGAGISQAVAAKKAGADPGSIGGSPTIVLVSATATLIATLLLIWSLYRLARERAFGRVLAAVSFGLAPYAGFAVVAIILIFLRSPDATAFEQLVPSNLTSALNLNDSGAALASLGSSLDLFSIWSIVLTIIGLSTVLGRKTGEAAAAVLIPWGAWVLLKTALAAMLG